MKYQNVSVFNSIIETKIAGVASLGEITESIRTGSIFQKDFSSTIEEIKSLLATGQIDKGRISQLKRSLPVFVPAVQCEERTTKSITAFNQLMVLDIDFEIGLKTIEELDGIKRYLFESEEHIVMAFLSPSKGVKVLINIGEECDSIEEYQRVFECVVDHYWKHHKIKIDTSGKDPIRACFFSYDPDALYRIESTPYKTQTEAPKIELEDIDDDRFSMFDYTPESTTNRICLSKTDTTDYDKVVLDFCKKILALEELDNQELIYSKHEELMKIQFEAWLEIEAEHLSEESTRNQLREAWSSLYAFQPDRYEEKMDDFDRAWIGARNHIRYFHESLNISGKQQKRYLDFFGYSDYLEAVEGRATETLLSLKTTSGDITFLTRNKLACLIALPGSGKSSIAESILAKVIEPNCEGIHFEPGESIQRVLLIDTENDNGDVAFALDRLSRRCDAPVMDILSQSKVYFLSLLQYQVKVGHNVKLIDLIRDILRNQHFDLIIVDDASGIVEYADEGVNSLSASKDAVNALKLMALKHKCGFLLTVHPNSQQANGKARGHLGSNLERYSMSVLHLVRNEIVYLISPNSSSAKLRRGSIHVLKENPLRFVFDPDKNFMVEKKDDLHSEAQKQAKDETFKNIRSEMTEYINKVIEEAGQIARKDVLTFMKDKFKDIAYDVIEKQYDIWKKKNISNYRFFQNGKFAYIAKRTIS